MSVLVLTPEIVEREPGFIPGVSGAGHIQLPSVVVESLEGAHGGGPQTSPVLSTICPYGGQPPE
jgi:hypothetical protein